MLSKLSFIVIFLILTLQSYGLFLDKTSIFLYLFCVLTLIKEIFLIHYIFYVNMIKILYF